MDSVEGFSVIDKPGDWIVLHELKDFSSLGPHHRLWSCSCLVNGDALPHNSFSMYEIVASRALRKGEYIWMGLILLRGGDRGFLLRE